jgi:ligand-binding SRPBCC domain-containing protein
MGWEGKPYVGAELLIRARGPGGIPVRWRARYVEVEGPRAVVGGVEARFVDEQVSGPFWKWRHSHEFEAVTSGRTRCVDHVEYVPWGWPLAVPVDWWVIRPKLAEMFEYRHRVLRQVFGD